MCWRLGCGAGEPLIVSTTAHQRDNAAWMARQGAAVHLPQDELTPLSLAGVLAAQIPWQMQSPRISFADGLETIPSVIVPSY